MGGVGPGEVLNGRYELIDRIGGGSMGEVWRGRDLVLGRTVAVKIVLPTLVDAPTFQERFAAEARVMAMIDHPGVVGVFDYGYTPADHGPATAFLVMEFIDGESLDRILARLGPLEPGFVLETMASLLDALAAVHRQGVVHRDIKPGNVMLRQEGVVLADFGIARSPESLGLTAADKLMGTVPYLAPEVFRSEAPATPAADVYAVGVLAFELLDGLPPFHASTTAAVMFKHVNEPPPPLPEYVPDELVQLLDRALAKNPADRWPDASAMAVAVRAVLAGGSVPEWEPVVAEPVRRRSAGAGADGAALEAGNGSGEGERRAAGRNGSTEADRRAAEGNGSDGSERYASTGTGRHSADRGTRPGSSGDGIGRNGSDGTVRDDARAEGVGGAYGRGGGRHGSGESPAGPSWRDGATGPGTHAGGARQGSEGVERGGGGRRGSGESVSWREEAGAPGTHAGGRRGSDGAERDDARLEGAGAGHARGGGGRHGSGESARHAAGPRHSTEIELHSTAVMRRKADADGTGDADRPNRRRALIPAVAGVAAVALVVVIVAASEGSGSSGSAKDDKSGQPAAAPTLPGDATPSSFALPTPVGGSSTTRSRNSSQASPSHSGTHTGTAGPATPTGSAISSGRITSTPSTLGSPSRGGGSTTSTTSTTPPTSPASSTSSTGQVPVPDVKTQTMDSAHTTLTAKGFAYTDNKTGTGTTCVVSSQTPAGGTMAVPATTTVTLDITCS